MDWCVGQIRNLASEQPKVVAKMAERLKALRTGSRTRKA